MVPGFNTDFKYRGETYHIQTEDNGVNNPVVVTLLYHKGAILASRRTSYREIAGKPGYEKELSALMKTQHKGLMHELLKGALDTDGAAPAVPENTGQNPADAAAAVLARNAVQQKAPPRPPRLIPAAAPAPLQPATAAAAADKLGAIRAALRAGADSRAVQPPAPAQPLAATPAAAETLDEAIWNYLAEHAAASACEVR